MWTNIKFCWFSVDDCSEGANSTASVSKYASGCKPGEKTPARNRFIKSKGDYIFFILIFIFRATNLARIVIAVVHEKNFLFIKFWLFLVECCIEKSNNRASTSTSQYAPESKSTTRNRFIKSKGDCMLYYFDIQFSSNQCKHFGQNCNRCRLWKKFPIHWVLFIFSWIMYRENYQGSVRKIVRISKGCRILLPRWGICYFFSMFRIYI